jgi:hypothetical protein
MSNDNVRFLHETTRRAREEVEGGSVLYGLFLFGLLFLCCMGAIAIGLVVVALPGIGLLKLLGVL